MLSTKRATITAAKIANPNEMPVNNWMRLESGVVIMDPWSSPVVFVRLTLLQKWAPQKSKISSLTLVLFDVSVDKTINHLLEYIKVLQVLKTKEHCDEAYRVN